MVCLLLQILLFALISTEELEQQGRIAVKQLKNRYNDLTFNRKFVVGIDRAKMSLHDVADSAESIIQDTEEEDVVTLDQILKQPKSTI